MKTFRKKKGYSKSVTYPRQEDVLFEIEILSGDRVEVRSRDRDDYVILSLGKSAKNKLTSTKEPNITGNVYVVKGENLILETEIGPRGISHGDKMLALATKKKLVNKVNRVYSPKGKYSETSDFQPSFGKFDYETV